jgi:tRNA (guanine26-N2/guanine27-N2)-dimethyltransferase
MKRYLPDVSNKALRLVLNSIATTAAKYGRAVEPLLCLSIDFYVRMFIRVVQSPAQVKFLARYSSGGLT